MRAGRTCHDNKTAVLWRQQLHKPESRPNLARERWINMISVLRGGMGIWPCKDMVDSVLVSRL